MAASSQLLWLPETSDWREQVRALAVGGDIERAIGLANTRLDFVRTNALDTIARKRFGNSHGDLGTVPVRLALLGSSTLTHLHAGIRVAGLRRRIWIETYECQYGQYLQELLDPSSALHQFAPTAVLFSFDARHLCQGFDAGMDAAAAQLALEEVQQQLGTVWARARESFGGMVLQQTAVNIFPPILGNNEARLPGSRHQAVRRINEWIRSNSDAAGVDVVAVDDCIGRDGLAAWHDPALWHRSKQEISPIAGPGWGDLVARVLAARQGRSYKALVLDLDNTLWGGVIGDDGLDGIVLGQGSALGEGFVAVQEYAKELSRRGIILAVASKNDEANALEPFDKHPEMILRRGDIAAFRADWNDKAANIRALAADLNIGIDSLVFLDDNPFERTLVRQELPMVAVPEVSDDPAQIPMLLAAAGYFEGVSVTSEDRERTQQYQGNRAREHLKATSTNLHDYLKSLEMRMTWRRFDRVGLQRTVQLINKTNQFNLTVRRYTEEQVVALIDDPKAFGLQLRLEDRFGDNGIISIIIGRLANDERVDIDTWLMSCRVLGRQVETTTLGLVVEQARLLGAKRLVGEYIPSKKNGMVKQHYERLGFSVVSQGDDGSSRAELDLAHYQAVPSFIEVSESL